MPAALAAFGLCLTRVPVAAQSVTDPAPSVHEAEAAVYAANEPGRALKDGKVIHAFRVMARPPAIDGRLNDEVWALAEAAGNFIQRDPDNGRIMTEGTRIQIAYDDRYVYVAIASDDSTPDAIAAGLGRREEFPSTDYVGVAFSADATHVLMVKMSYWFNR